MVTDKRPHPVDALCQPQVLCAPVVWCSAYPVGADDPSVAPDPLNSGSEAVFGADGGVDGQRSLVRGTLGQARYVGLK